MKKMMIIVLFTTILTTVKAQSILNKAKGVATTAGFDVTTLTKGITDQLTAKLGLSATQLPKVTNAVTTFMQAKSQILPLLKTNTDEYGKKQTAIFNNLKTAMR